MRWRAWAISPSAAATTEAASQYLSRAADLGGDASATRRQQAADALFYGQLAQAQQAYKQGNISRGAGALRAVGAAERGAGRLGEAVPRRCAAAQQRFAPRRSKRCAHC